MRHDVVHTELCFCAPVRLRPEVERVTAYVEEPHSAELKERIES